MLRGLVNYVPACNMSTCAFGPFDLGDNSTIAVVVVCGRRSVMRDVATVDDVHAVTRQYWLHGLPGEAATDDDESGGDSDGEVVRMLGELVL